MQLGFIGLGRMGGNIAALRDTTYAPALADAARLAA